MQHKESQLILLDTRRFTKVDKLGRLRSYVEFNCVDCGKQSLQRSDEYNRKGNICKKCKIKNNSAIELKTKDLELVAASNLLSKLQRRYLKKGLTSNLNSQELLDLVKRNCHYCNAEPSNLMQYKQIHFSYNFIYNGLDRVDSSKGYIKGNVLPSCKKCNIAKSDLSYNEFLQHIEKIYKNLKDASN
jgi:predicted RNA-binding Zn-ribbon protein involved in translation (DUF1610 family)